MIFGALKNHILWIHLISVCQVFDREVIGMTLLLLLLLGYHYPLGSNDSSVKQFRCMDICFLVFLWQQKASFCIKARQFASKRVIFHQRRDVNYHKCFWKVFEKYLKRICKGLKINRKVLQHCKVLQFCKLSCNFIFFFAVLD